MTSTSTSLLVDVAPRAGKIIKYGLKVFKEEKICYKNGVLHFVFRFSHRQKSRYLNG